MSNTFETRSAGDGMASVCSGMYVVFSAVAVIITAFGTHVPDNLLFWSAAGAVIVLVVWAIYSRIVYSMWLYFE